MPKVIATAIDKNMANRFNIVAANIWGFNMEKLKSNIYPIKKMIIDAEDRFMSMVSSCAES